MSIEVLNEVGYDLSEIELVGVSRYVLEEMRVHPQAELCIRLVDEETMTVLHEQWMDLPGPTDVMSFPMDELRPGPEGETSDEGVLGDIVLCPAVTSRQAAEHGRSADEEAEYLLVHGLLHLLGFDHGTPEEKQEMFSLKDELLSRWARERERT